MTLSAYVLCSLYVDKTHSDDFVGLTRNITRGLQFFDLCHRGHLAQCSNCISELLYRQTTVFLWHETVKGSLHICEKGSITKGNPCVKRNLNSDWQIERRVKKSSCLLSNNFTFNNLPIRLSRLRLLQALQIADTESILLIKIDTRVYLMRCFKLDMCLYLTAISLSIYQSALEMFSAWWPLWGMIRYSTSHAQILLEVPLWRLFVTFPKLFLNFVCKQNQQNENR